VESMSVLGSFDDMMEFNEHFGHNLQNIASTATLRVFKASVQPAWEHPANAGPGAGKWGILLPNKRCSVSAFLALLQAMVSGGLNCANGVVLQKKNRQHMVMVWTQAEDSTMIKQRAAIQALLPEPSLAKLSFKSHVRAKNRNTKEEVLCELQNGRHARTASLEVHFDMSSRGSFDLKGLGSPVTDTSDYTNSPSSQNTDVDGCNTVMQKLATTTIMEEGESPASSQGDPSYGALQESTEWEAEGEVTLSAAYEAAERLALQSGSDSDSNSSQDNSVKKIPRVATFEDLGEEAKSPEIKATMTRVGTFIDLAEVEEELKAT